MKKVFILFLIIFIGIISSLFPITQRMYIESENKTVNIVLDYDEIEKLAQQSEHDLMWWMTQFKKIGINYIALKEHSIERMIQEKKQLEVLTVDAITSQKNWRENYPQALVDKIEKEILDKYDIVVFFDLFDDFQYVKTQLEQRYEKKLFLALENYEYQLLILKAVKEDALYGLPTQLIDNEGKMFSSQPNLVSSKLIRLGLGLDPEKVNMIKESGLNVLPRPYHYDGWTTEKQMNATFMEYEKYGITPPVFIFDSAYVFGYPDDMHVVKEYMQKNHIKVGLIETVVQRMHIEQEGIDELTVALDYDAVRIFSVPEYIQLRFQHYNYDGAEEIENTFYRAVTERNIRLIYFRPFKIDRNTYVTDFEEYEKMFLRFENRIAKHRMTLGDSSSMPNIQSSTIIQLMMAGAIVAASVLLLKYLMPLNNKTIYILIGLGMIISFALSLIFPFWAEKLYAMLAAIIFPSLGMIYFISRSTFYTRKPEQNTSIVTTILIGARELMIVSGISILGAVFVSAFLSSTQYLLEMDLYRGVKFSQLVPIIIYIFAYISYFGYKRGNVKKNTKYIEYNDLKNLLNDNIRVISCMLAGILFFAGYIYIARTGHETNVQAMELELIVRNILEERLLARPRTKEFIIAFPAIILGIYFSIKKYKKFIFISGLIAVIGQTSIVNTFSHLRTPLYMSFVRTVHSLGFSVIFAILYILSIVCITKLSSKFIKL